MACAITWHAWPKMIMTPMRCPLTSRGAAHQSQSPTRSRRRLSTRSSRLIGGFRRVSRSSVIDRRSTSGSSRSIATSSAPRRPEYPSSFEPPIDSPVHHVALLRAPHFVVQYLAGDALPGDVAEYAGVFEVDEAVDDTFAKAEPPTHDDWVASQLQGEERTWVGRRSRESRERLRGFARPAVFDTVGVAGDPARGGERPVRESCCDLASLGATSYPPGTSGATGASLQAEAAEAEEAAAGETEGAMEATVGPAGRLAVDRGQGSVQEVDEPEYGTRSTAIRLCCSRFEFGAPNRTRS